MASVLVDAGPHLRLYNKGAAEMVISRCTAAVGASGAAAPLSDAGRAEMEAVVTAMASRGLRTLCLAYTDFPKEDASRPEDFFEKPHALEHNLTALCIVGIKVGRVTWRGGMGGWGGVGGVMVGGGLFLLLPALRCAVMSCASRSRPAPALQTQAGG